MASIPELVRQSKQDAQLSSDSQYTQHIRYVSKRGQRKVKEEEQWKRERMLGRGTFGLVYLEKCIRGNEQGKVRAVKEIRKPENNNYYRELEAAALFSYPKYQHCFVQSFGWYENTDSIFVTMEYLRLGDLHKNLGSPLPEHEGQQIVTQILEGLDFMHDNDFAHRDLKPANILVVTKGPRWWVKVADFGISKRAVEGLTALHTLTGTPAFTAPEVLGFGSGSINEEPGDSYTNAVDIWSTGVITFLILTGEIYFKDQRRLFQYAAGTIGFPLDTLRARSTSESGCAFTKTLMQATPQHRPTVKQALQHAWLIDLNCTATYDPPRTSDLRGGSPSTASSSESEFSAQWSTQDRVPMVNSQGPVDLEPSASWSTQDRYSVDKPSTLQSRGTVRRSAPRRAVEAAQGGSSDINVQIPIDPEPSASRSSQDCYSVGEPSASDSSVTTRESATTCTAETTILANTQIMYYWKGMKRLKGHGSWARGVAFSPDGRLVASGSSDKTVRLWEVATGAEVRMLEGHGGYGDSVNGVAFSPDGRLVASGSDDKTVRLWEAATADRTIRGRIKRLFL